MIMKKTSLILSSVLISLLFITSCSKNESNDVEVYSEYLSVELDLVDEIIMEPIYTLQIRNSSTKIFEQQCTLIYSIIDQESNETITESRQVVVNKRIPSDTSQGYLNIQSGGNYIQVANLNNLNWIGEDFIKLEVGEYILVVSLFIDDPSSPFNTIESNESIFIKY